ncbi:MAG: YqaJ viral recombinase family protein, partial [Selenomonadaceae bacterium]|nr:YqaJ viral recombinase family protein [Selenomonadaceae bacterium]
MAKTIIAKNIDTMPRKDWLALRSRGIGGSDCAAACGLSRWKSPLQLFVEKTSKVKMEE